MFLYGLVSNANTVFDGLSQKGLLTRLLLSLPYAMNGLLLFSPF
jgi:hypothetical protein